jgi:hypothetical protein
MALALIPQKRGATPLLSAAHDVGQVLQNGFELDSSVLDYIYRWASNILRVSSLVQYFQN